jgi:hypothetical protein
LCELKILGCTEPEVLAGAALRVALSMVLSVVLPRL